MSTPVVAALSPSRASDFMQCPLLYRFRTIDRLPEPPAPAAARGTLVHATLERLFDLPAEQRTVEQAVALLPQTWSALVEERPELADLASGETTSLDDWLGAAGSLVERWFGMEDPTRLEPAERELYVEVESGGIRLRGYVDRLDVAPGGAMRVVDYKTGRAPGPGFESKALFQMKFYALCLWRLRGEIPQRLRLVYLGSGEIVELAPEQRDLEWLEKKLAALWQAIERAATTGDWRPNRSRLCDWCAHQALCPAWGGTPPPLPEVTVQPLVAAGEVEPPGGD